jgi:hypothetical protein
MKIFGIKLFERNTNAHNDDTPSIDNSISGNAIIEIEIYRSDFGSWVFDDNRVGLYREPFVSGIDKMIDTLTSDMENANKGFIARFSEFEFPGKQFTLRWKRSEHGGNWYYSNEIKIEGWLCPALYKYFKIAPKQIHFQILRKVAQQGDRPEPVSNHNQ